ncbi:hypothetical protein KL918_002522 [Ogataea parapolymorpha]|uniref:DNA replication complex GINS protein PSF1 n=1 Tax=Ogataea parapolymorpha (strain ATCC 26012 / BCRC 20466 / JCM 22074 / NRRL Y-7560 / DL-1) TaxID=871575 RepID=W1QKF4_OGAPD|nr:Subunit of the GINS complex (Sld5p, Psf1p, Psf2p, Psf3p) [Ogataea parapolymorpha DL-1]ESX02710.1 Subunit of the GINS complex (Sld5p, Psf1p, Psf2p, Psf3p) [Ogataea parapolymorpha DL-1]KAG7867925.1 hypothetical protein KL918_002522 [Ogataea parapolymorpha]KAG7870497.1 hypothetical protein KL916_004973 [Ogataea parapolymorpha]
MYGDLAHKLALEAKRTQSLDKLPLYQDTLVRAIVREIRDLQKEADVLTEHASQDDDRVNQAQLFVCHLCMRRNKRCLLAYQRLRAERLDELVWANNEISKEQMDNLSPQEQEYLKKYNDLVSEFKGPLEKVDLGGTLEPPEDVFIDVRVLKDAGEIQTEYGVFNLTKDSQFFVRQADVERLIQQGYLKKL